MHSLVNEQQEELRRAVFGHGKWRFRRQFLYLQLTNSDWFAMSSKQTDQYIKSRVHNTCVEDANDQFSEAVTAMQPRDDEPCSPRDLLAVSQSGSLSIDVSSFAQGLSIPFASLEGIWKKAENLLSSGESLALAPGHGAEARMVKGTSDKQPHLVKPGKGGRFICDGDYKALGICSHVVATAEANNKLIEFSGYYCKIKKSPSFNEMAKSDMSSGRGRKESVPPRKGKKSEPIDTRVPMTPSNLTNTSGQLPAEMYHSYVLHGINGAAQFSPLYSYYAHVSYSHITFSSAIFNAKL